MKLSKFLNRKFSLELLNHLSFTPNFFKAVKKRLLPNNNYLLLDILPGEGCGGFTYEFKSQSEKLEGD